MFNQRISYEGMPVLQVTIVGLGNTGRSILNNLLNHKSHRLEINIIDPSADVAGSVMDLSHTSAVDKRHSVVVNDQKRFNQAQYVFYAAGKAIPIGNDRNYNLAVNQEIAFDVFRDFSPVGKPLVIVLTNPNDVITHLLHHILEGRCAQVVGTGTFIDTLRLEWLIAQLMAIDTTDVSAWIIGEHGDNMVPILSHTLVQGRPVRDELKKEWIRDLIYETRRAAHRIKETQGASYFAAAKCATFVMESHLVSNGQMIPLSMFDPDREVTYSRPIRFVDSAIEPVEGFHLEPQENEALELSLQKLNAQQREVLQGLEQNHGFL